MYKVTVRCSAVLLEMRCDVARGFGIQIENHYRRNAPVIEIMCVDRLDLGPVLCAVMDLHPLLVVNDAPLGVTRLCSTSQRLERIIDRFLLGERLV